MTYTAEDAERAARDPGALREDNPPMLRFAHDTMENRIESERQGRYIHEPITKVFVRAHGDTKSEVPFVVEGWTIEEQDVQVEEKRIIVRYVDGERVEEETMDTVNKSEAVLVPCTPWLDRLKERLHHGQITRKYHDYCVQAYEHWKENGEVPISGYPVKEWRQINLAQANNLINLGFRTIEEVAQMTEEGMKSYGMGGRELKRKAVAFLEASNDNEKAAAKIATLESSVETERERNNALAEKLASLEAKMNEKPSKKTKAA